MLFPRQRRVRRGSDGPRFATSTPLSKPKRGPVRRGCRVPSNPLQRALVCPEILFGAPLSVPELVRHTSRRALSPVVPLQLRDLIAVRLARAIPSQAGTLLRRERRTHGSTRCFPVHAMEVSLKCLPSTLPHSSASRLRPALSSRQ